MRKLGLALVALSIILLMVSPSFAQSPRQPTSSEGKTTFTNIGLTGLDATGVPGYIEMLATDGDIAYIFVDDDLILRIASGPPVGTGASPQTTDWTTGNPGVVVGVQVAP